MAQEHTESGRHDSCLCLSCGQQFEASAEQSGEKPAKLLVCPACRSHHILNLTVDAKQPSCGTGGWGFSFG
ncbi:MAG: hypothetical protein ACM3RP_12190 [Chitinophagales bacterium]